MSERPENPPAPARVPGPMYVNRTDRELGVTGIQTFMKLPVCLTPADLVKGRSTLTGQHLADYVGA